MQSISQMRKNVFWAIMDLEKAFYTIDRHGMRQMLTVYGIGGKVVESSAEFLC